MKNIYIIISLLLVLACSVSFAQQQLGIQVTQDGKLAVLGDKEHGYNAGTLDVCIKIMMQGHQQKAGYMIVYPELEYADLKYVVYRRWSANIGYVFNNFCRGKQCEAGASISYGFIDRGLTDFSLGGNMYLQYNLTDRLKLVANCQLTERTDLAILYGKEFKGEWRQSLHFGIQINLHRSYARR